ncbi:MAG: hypothetical protein ACRDQA_01155 [Nocardioidaceae bacterium]
MAGGFAVEEIGDSFPDLPLSNIHGDALRISSFRGARLLIFSWSSW